jgi:biopolymer transport protein ExbD
MGAKVRVKQERDEVDMTAMIDLIFLLIIFFILAGKITSDLKSELITVPPTFTAETIEIPDEWGHIVIDVFGTTQKGVANQPPRNTIKVDKHIWYSEGTDNFKGYIGLREVLDLSYARAAKYTDPKTGMQLPKIIVEVRADGDAEYRLVQEIQQVLSDTIDPNTFTPRAITNPKEQLKPFVNLLFTTRRPGDVNN